MIEKSPFFHVRFFYQKTYFQNIRKLFKSLKFKNTIFVYSDHK